MSNEQNIFTMAYVGLALQGFKKSVDDVDVHCMYRGENGLKCAIGHCIPDEEYREEFECIDGIFAIMNGVSSLKGMTLHFLKHLQDCHDNATSPENMKSRLINFANWHNLIIPEI